jgi:tetratricopeptide (TPR) repeat protein
MAPEMALGLGEHLGPWTDVYLLGSILHEILTGGPPHRTGGDLHSVLLKAAESEPPMFPSETPAELAAICRRAVARQPRDRYRSVSEFQGALEEYLRHRESLLISDRAEAELQSAAAVPRGARQDLRAVYSRYAMAVARYVQAVELWEGNRRAGEGLLRAREAYARAALQGGDLGLAESLAGELGGDVGAGLRLEIRRERAGREAREASARRMRVGLRAAVVVILAGVAAASTIIAAKSREAVRAEEAKRTAMQGQRQAELDRQRAETERERESGKRLEAEAQRERERARRLESELAAADRARRRMQAFGPYAQATDLVNRGQRLDDAARLLQQALKIDPEFPEAQFALGEALRFSGDPLKAAEAYELADALSRALGGRPNLQALLAAGFMLDGAAVYDRAEALFARAEELGKDEPLALVGKSFRCGHFRRWREALQTAQRALQAGPHLWETYFGLGYVKHECLSEGVLRGDLTTHTDVVQHFERAMALSPRQAEICQWLGLALGRRNGPGDRDRALALYDRAIELEPRNGARYIHRARERYPYDKAAALADFEKGRNLGAGALAIKQVQAVWANREGRGEESRQILKEVIDQSPAWPAITANYLIISINMGKFQEVKPLYDRWCRQNEHYQEVHHLRAIEAWRRGDAKQAAACAREGLKIAPYKDTLHEAVIKAYVLARQFADALKAAEAAIDACPSSALPRLLRAQILAAVGRADDAEQALVEIEAKFPYARPQALLLRSQFRGKAN